MDCPPVELILRDRGIAYIIVDRNLDIVEGGGTLAVLAGGAQIATRGSLLDLIPELIGSEEVLADVCAGDMPRFQLEYINRTTPDRDTRYLTVTVLPYQDEIVQAALLIVAADTTEQGRDGQKLTQQRNELRLLRRDLAQANGQLNYLLSRYVSTEVAGALKEPRVLPQLGGELREVSVLFADIREYTSISERMSPGQMMELLNEYLGIASAVIAEVGGTITGFVGDAVLALFNAPDDLPDHAWRAVRAGMVLQRRAATHECRVLQGVPSPPFGVGVNTGPALVGNIGTVWRYHYTAIGDTVNLAQRICSAAGAGEVLVGQTVYASLRQRLAVSPLAPIHFRGRSQPTPVYRVNDAQEETIGEV